MCRPCISIDPDLVKLAAADVDTGTISYWTARTLAAAEAIGAGVVIPRTSNIIKCIDNVRVENLVSLRDDYTARVRPCRSGRA